MSSGTDTGRSAYVLAIDLGTGGPKVALVSTDGEVIGHEFEATQVLLRPGGGAEQDPEQWWRAIVTASQRLLGRQLVAAADVVAVSCTGQWAGTVAVDADGQPLMNAIIWMDARGGNHTKRVVDGLVKTAGYSPGKLWRWVRLTGGAPSLSGKDSLGHILFIKHELSEIYQRTYKFLEPVDYINLRLTGRFATSYETATLHWLTDNRNLASVSYDTRLIAISTVAADKLPELRPTASLLGPIAPQVAAELGLGEHAQVTMATPDTMSAAVGSGATPDYEAHLYIGTSSWLSCHVPFKKTDPFHGIASLPASLPGRYLVSTEQQTAGASLTHLHDNILFDAAQPSTAPVPQDGFEMLNRLAAAVPAGSDKVIFTPWLYGERTPVDDPLVRGGFFNLSLDTTRGHLVRATLEGVALNARWMHKYVERFVKRRLDPIAFIGGGAKSDLWCQIVADVLDRTIKQVADPMHANVRGAAFPASSALGKLALERVPERVPVTASFHPNADNRQLYDELFNEFVNIYKANKRMYARLNSR